jgi:GNAT superfamily N-acetyltransferase
LRYFAPPGYFLVVDHAGSRLLPGMDDFAVRAAARWRAIDQLLPDPFPPGPGPDCGARLAVGAGGNLAALGACCHVRPDPAGIDLSWGMARRFELSPRILGPDAAGALDRLISLWREHLASVPGSDADDTAAVVTWPSRDVEGVAALQAHRLQPLAVVAIRPGAAPGVAAAGARHRGRAGRGGSRRGPGRGIAGRDLRIRQARAADADTVTRFGVEVVRFDAHFTGTPARAGTAAVMRREAEHLLTASGGPAGGGAASGPAGSAAGATAPGGAWTWLAERHDGPVGVIATQRPEQATWIAPLTRLTPVAYTVLGYVRPDERSAGVGAALAARLHDVLDDEGIAATLLHYAQLNPYAAPFWSRQGYRPLWTIWEARPARTLR